MALPTAEVAPPAPTPGGGSGGNRRRLGPVRRSVREVGLALITLGVIILLFVAYQLWGTGIAEAHSQSVLKRGFNAAIAPHSSSGDNPTLGTGTALSSPTAAVGGAIDHLVIPKIHLDVYVVQGVADEDLRRGPGHYPQTVMPGQNGNAAIAGHRTTYGAPFFSADELAIGDSILLTDTADRTFVYKVSARPRVVSPDDVAVLDNTPFPQLTLTTCNPRFSATSRLVIVARLTGPPPLSATHPANLGPVAAIDNLGKGNGGAWPPSIFYGALMVLLWVGTRILINRTRRWARAGAYLGGIVVCLVPLWFCFENVVRLLPQNI
jgi:sortase A